MPDPQTAGSYDDCDIVDCANTPTRSVWQADGAGGWHRNDLCDAHARNWPRPGDVVTPLEVTPEDSR